MSSKFFDIFSKNKETKEELKVEVDFREKNSLVPSLLMKEGLVIEWKQLPVGDYIVNGVAIERKSVSDLKGSIISKRIVSQLFELKQYERGILVVEGIIEEDVYSGGIHENAFRGFLLSVALDFQVPIIFTHDSKDTAKYLSVLARKKDKEGAGIRATKIHLTNEEQVQFILEGFPNVGAVKAKKLVEKFGSLKNIFEAPTEKLEEILGKRAKAFRDLILFGNNGSS